MDLYDLNNLRQWIGITRGRAMRKRGYVILVKPRCVCETLQYAPGGNKVEKASFSFQVKVKVTRSLTLVSIEKGIISGVCMPNMKFLSITVQKL